MDCAGWEDEPSEECDLDLRTGYITIGVFVGVGLLFLVFCFVALLFFRNRARIRAAGFVFLMLSCFASVVGLVSVFFTFGKPRPSYCMTFYWLLVLGAST
eukprot:TRINITY_DN1001_c0_g1_i1.p1 TRINITY_DN1001_c0_g1~~TRINITY_DN1001_c0_g1_i1.p1  ORF type:complete len:100 (-),score=8.02 TRINITY_DN1001_c0_g1_i1:718-1017(-)